MKYFRNCALLAGCLLLLADWKAYGQGMHFTQYYHAPLLLSPANAGLSPDKDYRVGASYRSQWVAYPAPYITISGYGDFSLMRNRSNGKSWLGIGLAAFNDKVGDGELSLTRGELFIAYHLLLSEHSMISAGVSAAWCQRSVNFATLSFDEQWDGFSFSSALPSGEPGAVVQTSYADVGAGINYAWFPDSWIYIKAGAALAHLNQPVETFYKTDNRIGIRATGNIEVVLKAGESLIVTPSAYYTQQENARELAYGSLLNIPLGDSYANYGQLIFGAFHRPDDAFIMAAGYEWHAGLRIMASYDITSSALGAVAKGAGSFELGLRFQGTYRDAQRTRNVYGCPQF